MNNTSTRATSLCSYGSQPKTSLEAPDPLLNTGAIVGKEHV